MNRKLSETIQAQCDKQIKAQREEIEKRKPSVIEREKKLAQKRETLKVEFAALQKPTI